ncbi:MULTISPECIES: peptidylprolyl isomerase [unclassified Eikenella]|uniref:peptidylprolyl isomerase n=1 Tax=unclassified Eikenella TaxID=2639367 RepID=UPI0008A2A7E9|nr:MULTISPECIES: peptidylprolyl isomerase [unclassified Eikenella]OFK87168.1 peptidylprolyl isomerase [Eikenella sp. HMSC071B05]OFO45000.1 peptidylprolyl isomerase [Eikenella sp. HMSC073A11]
MFAIVEKHRRLSQVLLGLITVTFVGFGAQTLTSGMHSSYISKIGNTHITAEQVQELLREAPRHSDQPISKDDVYQSLVQQAYFEQGAAELGVGELSLEQIKGVITRDPSFQVNGQFSPDQFQSYLRQRGITEDRLIDEMRRQYRRQTLISLLSNGNIVSDSQVNQILALTGSERELRTAPFNAADFASKVQPTDAALRSYFEANKAKYALPLAVKLEFVDLNVEELAKQQTVSAQELQEAYRNLPTTASEAKPPFESVKTQLEESVRQRKAAQALGNAREQLAQLAFDHPDSLQKVAQEMKLPLQKHEEWLSQPEAAADKLPQAVQEAMFSAEVIERRHNSEVLDMGNGVLRVLRATDVSKARNQSFEEAKEAVRKDYVAVESAKLAQAAAAQALSNLQAGKAVDNLQWSNPEKASATQLQQAVGLQNFAAIVKAHPQNGKPGYAVITLPNGNAAVVEVRAISLPENSKQQLPELRQQVAGRNTEAFYRQYLQVLQRKYPIQHGSQKLDRDEN